MTRKCVVCNKLYIKGSDETFHSFPKDELRKKLWLKACKIKLCLPSNKICGDHFLPKHYSLSGYLLKNAVPFLASTSTDIKPLMNDQDASSPCPLPLKIACVQSLAPTSTDIKPLMNYQGASRPCPLPLKIACVQSLAPTSTDIKPLMNDQGASRPCPLPLKIAYVKPIPPMNPDTEPLDYPIVNCTITYSPSQNPKRKILNASTIGSLSPSHFGSPRKAKIHLDMVKYKFKEKQVQNTNLKKQIKRLKKKIEKDSECIQSLNRLLQEKERKEKLNANIIGVLSPSQLISAKKAKAHLDMKKYKFKEKQIQNENLKNEIQRLKNCTVQQDHDYI